MPSLKKTSYDKSGGSRFHRAKQRAAATRWSGEPYDLVEQFISHYLRQCGYLGAKGRIHSLKCATSLPRERRGKKAARMEAQIHRWCEKKLTEDGIGGPRIYVVRTFAAPLLRCDRKEAGKADAEEERQKEGARKKEREKETGSE